MLPKQQIFSQKPANLDRNKSQGEGQQRVSMSFTHGSQGLLDPGFPSGSKSSKHHPRQHTPALPVWFSFLSFNSAKFQNSNFHIPPRRQKAAFLSGADAHRRASPALGITHRELRPPHLQHHGNAGKLNWVQTQTGSRLEP